MRVFEDFPDLKKFEKIQDLSIIRAWAPYN